MIPKQRRTSRAIDRKFQLMLLLRSAVQLTAFLAMGFGLLIVWEFLLSGPDANLDSCFTAVWNRYAPAIIVLAALLPVVVYDTFRLSNRIAGPVFRIRGVLRRLAQCETVETIKLRRNDFWQDLATDVNRLIVRGGVPVFPGDRDSNFDQADHGADSPVRAHAESMSV